MPTPQMFLGYFVIQRLFEPFLRVLLSGKLNLKRVALAGELQKRGYLTVLWRVGRFWLARLYHGEACLDSQPHE